jgi:hypothetical protein
MSKFHFIKIKIDQELFFYPFRIRGAQGLFPDSSFNDGVDLKQGDWRNDYFQTPTVVYQDTVNGHGVGVKRKIPPAGIEPATPGLGNLCSIQLSYGGIDQNYH